MLRWASGVVAAILCCATVSWATDPPGERTREESADEVPPLARRILHERMLRHSADMQRLTQALLQLDRPVVAELAQRIAAEPQFARPLTGDASELNVRIPPGFFKYQDELRGRARRLAHAARHGDDDRLAAAYAALAETCVRCHAAYRKAQK